MASIKGVIGTVDITRNYVICGVYFLCDGDEVIYVGSSINVYSRISDHQRERDRGYANSKPFNRVHFLKCEASELEQLENKYIEEFKPRCNGRHSNGKLVKQVGPRRSNEVIPPPIFKGVRRLAAVRIFPEALD